MSLTSALGNALSGLRFTSVATGLASANVANAGNASYTRKTVSPVSLLGGETIGGVRASAVKREYDAFVQRQLITERANGLYASTRSDYLSRIDQLLGSPGSASSLDTVLNDFSAAFQALVTSPDSTSAQASVTGQATVVAQTLRNLSSNVQSMRLEAEKSLSDSVQTVNSILESLASLNQRLKISGDDAARAGLLDQRDALVDQLSQYADLRVSYDSNDAVSISVGGVTLLGDKAVKLTFDAHGTIDPASRYSTDPTKRGVGTIVAETANGPVDLIANGTFKSGKIAALIELRDTSLVAAQDQLDQIAAGLAQTLGTSSTVTTASATGPGPTAGYQMALSPGLSDGDSVTVTLSANGQSQTFTFKRVDDPTVPITDDLTANPNDKVFRLTGTSAAGYASDMQAAIDAWAAGAGAPAGAFSVSASGSNLTVLADPTVTGGASVTGAQATVTARTLTDGGGALPFFVDPTAIGGLYTDRVTASGSQTVGLAARIEVNAALKADPTALVKMTGATQNADSTRPAFLAEALAGTGRYYGATTGLGTTASPFRGSLLSYAQAVISTQGSQAAAAQQLAEGQSVVVEQLQARFDSVAAVSIDEEMATLIQLQTAYGANARVMTAVKEMFEMLRTM